MNTLSERNEALLLLGAKATGKMEDAYFFVEEQLYIHEAKELYEFCLWVDKEIGGCGRANIRGLFQAFKHPDEPIYKAFASNVKRQLDELRKLIES